MQDRIENAISQEISRFEQEHLGRGPKHIDCYLMRDLLVIRLQDILTPAEQKLAKSLSAQAGRDLLKRVRTHLIETSRPLIDAMVERATGVGVLHLHHDISTDNGEEVFVFSLAAVPDGQPENSK